MLLTALFLQLISYQPNELNDFMKGVWSPYCKGISLLECPSGKAEQLRDDIRSEYEAGKTIGQIRASLRETYGNQVRMEPEQTWRGRLAYLIPWVAFFFVAMGVAFYWRRRSMKLQGANTSPETSRPMTSSEDEVLKEIENRLK